MLTILNLDSKAIHGPFACCSSQDTFPFTVKLNGDGVIEFNLSNFKSGEIACVP